MYARYFERLELIIYLAALNALANHGYIPRNGIASFAEIVNSVQEGFNMEYTLGSAITAFGMVRRVSK